MSNKFEELLASIVQDENDRKVVLEVGGKYPELRDGWLRQSDYSKNMDSLKKEQTEFKEKVSYADSMSNWWKENWINDAYGDGKGATKRELEKDNLIAELQKQISVGGEVTFEDLNKYLEETSKNKGWVSQETFNKALTEKETLVNKAFDDKLSNALANISHLMTKGPQLATRHLKDFGEVLDIESLTKLAVEKKLPTLDDAYQEMYRPQFEERAKKDLEAKLAAAREEGRKDALKVNAAQPPVDSGSPDMSAFQRFVQGVKPTEGEQNGRVVSDDVPFGKGHIAAQAAREYDRRAAEANAA